VLDWLLDADPAIRWQVLRDIADAPADVVAAERSRVATHGWGADLLARQSADGQWGGDPDIQAWTSSPEWFALMTLGELRELGLDPLSPQAQLAVALTRDNVTWHWWDNKPFFVGEVEPCINGRVVAIGAYFGQDVRGLVERLLGEQMADGGWNCEQENGSVRGSFNTTIDVLEGLLEYERATGESGAVGEGRRRAEEYLLERHLFRRLSSDEAADPGFIHLTYPWSYHYDILRGLDYLREAHDRPDERAGEAIELIRHKRGTDGRWPLDYQLPDLLDLDMGEREGQPSLWITLRATRVLAWFDQPPIDIE
jgi:hypothetical protein